MQPSDFTVVPSTVLKHAAGIEALASDVARAKQAGDTVRVDNEAYGRLCTIVPTLINNLQDMVLDAIGTADTSLQDTAQRLRTVAQSYLTSDSASEQASREIGSGG